MEKFVATIGRRWTFMEHMELPAYRDGLLVPKKDTTDISESGIQEVKKRPGDRTKVGSSDDRRQWRGAQGWGNKDDVGESMMTVAMLASRDEPRQPRRDDDCTTSSTRATDSAKASW